MPKVLRAIFFLLAASVLGSTSGAMAEDARLAWLARIEATAKKAYNAWAAIYPERLAQLVAVAEGLLSEHGTIFGEAPAEACLRLSTQQVTILRDSLEIAEGFMASTNGSSFAKEHRREIDRIQAAHKSFDLQVEECRAAIAGSGG